MSLPQLGHIKIKAPLSFSVGDFDRPTGRQRPFAGWNNLCGILFIFCLHHTPPTNVSSPTHLDDQQPLTRSYALQMCSFPWLTVAEWLLYLYSTKKEGCSKENKTIVDSFLLSFWFLNLAHAMVPVRITPPPVLYSLLCVKVKQRRYLVCIHFWQIALYYFASLNDVCPCQWYPTC